MTSIKFRFTGLGMTIFMVFLLFSNLACTQEKTYWQASNYNKVDGGAMHGFTLDYLEQLALKIQYLTKEGQMIHLDFPKNIDIKTDTLKSISYERVQQNPESDPKDAGKLLDSIYDISIDNGILQVKLYYRGTLDDDKRFVIKFEKITEQAYKKNIEEEHQYINRKEEAFAAFLKSYQMEAGWKTATHQPMRSTDLKETLGTVTASFPNNFQINHDGSFYKNTIDKMKVGTGVKNSVYYKIMMDNETETFADANLFIVKDAADSFNLQRYLSEKDFKVVEQDADSFHAVTLSYNDEKKSVNIARYISFKHLYKNGLHIIYLSDDGDAKDLKGLAKQHYVFMQHLSVK
jgi:hypothetical protein